MAREERLDVLFAEPSGIVIPFELRNTIMVAGRDAQVSTGPVVLLFDGTRPEAPFGEDVEHITLQQIIQSDLVVITKSAGADPEGLRRLESRIAQAAPRATVRRVDFHSGEGVPALVNAVLGGRKDKEVSSAA